MSYKRKCQWENLNCLIKLSSFEIVFCHCIKFSDILGKFFKKYKNTGRGKSEGGRNLYSSNIAYDDQISELLD